MRLRLWLLAALTCCAGLSDCTPPPAGCVPGASSACTCLDGRTGAQVCASDHTYGLCTCGAGGGAGGSSGGSSGGAGGSSSADPCGVAGKWTSVCQLGSAACSACGSSTALTSYIISAAIAANGGSWSEGGVAYSFATAGCTLTKSFAVNNACFNGTRDYSETLSSGTGTYSSTFTCWSGSNCTCTGSNTCTDTRGAAGGGSGGGTGGGTDGGLGGGSGGGSGGGTPCPGASSFACGGMQCTAPSQYCFVSVTNGVPISSCATTPTDTCGCGSGCSCVGAHILATCAGGTSCTEPGGQVTYVCTN